MSTPATPEIPVISQEKDQVLNFLFASCEALRRTTTETQQKLDQTVNVVLVQKKEIERLTEIISKLSPAADQQVTPEL